MTNAPTPLPPFGGEEAACPLADARVAVVPVPYEATVSYGGGTARGPEAILRASTQVELYDEQMRIEPFRSGLWTDAPLVLPDGPPETALRAVEGRVGELMDLGKWVVMLGGEHSITPGGVAAAAARHPGLHVVQLDAHADLRQEYEEDRWSHACAMARCVDLGVPITAIGIRNYGADEAAWIRRGIPGYRIVHAWEMADRDGAEAAVAALDGRPVYLTIDLDFFDPAVIPATGTPEPGGGAWWPTLRLLESLVRRSTVVGCDLVELAPVPGLHHADFAAARLAYKLIGMRFGGKT